MLVVAPQLLSRTAYPAGLRISPHRQPSEPVGDDTALFCKPRPHRTHPHGGPNAQNEHGFAKFQSRFEKNGG